MKVQVIKPFRDKNTKKIHRAGSEIDLTKKRMVEINSTEHGDFVREATTEKEE